MFSEGLYDGIFLKRRLLMRGKVVLLGTSSAVPTKERNNSSVYFSYEGEAFLFDCGEGTQRQIIQADLNMFKINRIFISHLHSDHVLGLPGLIQTIDFLGDKERIYVYGVKGIKEKGNCLLNGSIYEAEMETIFVEIEGRDEPCSVIETDKYKVKCISLNHTVDCLGFSFEEKERRIFDKEKVKFFNLTKEDFIKLKKDGYTYKRGRKINLDEVSTEKKGFKFTYIPDTYRTDNIIKLAKNSDILVIECTYFDEEDRALKYKHLTLKYILEIYPLLNAKKIILTHFSRRYKSLDIFENEIKKKNINNVYLGKDFMEFVF